MRKQSGILLALDRPAYSVSAKSRGHCCLSILWFQQGPYVQLKRLFLQDEVGDRFLFARTLSTANALKDHFENDSRRSTDPELDFPKVFYERKDEIVRKLDQLIKDNT
ncbi:MAG: hypothetical protein IPI55_03035 [Flavobacteriales bacterium]|nr:hypothetical protein [Flavobacteriales bacterium]